MQEERQLSVGLVNRALRRQLRDMHIRADSLFVALCGTNPAAEKAFGELWGSGEFDCGPQDYDFIVERCLEAVHEYNERRTQPTQSPQFHCE